MCIFICLTSMILCTFSNREIVLPPIQNVVGICKQITILILHQVTFMLATPLKVIYSSPSSGQKNPRARNQREFAATCSRWFLARGFFYPEDGGETFLRNVGSHNLHGSTPQKTAFIPSTKSHIHFLSLRSFIQGIRRGSRLFVIFRNKLTFMVRSC
jgi:hypothetical protein